MTQRHGWRPCRRADVCTEFFGPRWRMGQFGQSAGVEDPEVVESHRFHGVFVRLLGEARLEDLDARMRGIGDWVGFGRMTKLRHPNKDHSWLGCLHPEHRLFFDVAVHEVGEEGQGQAALDAITATKSEVERFRESLAVAEARLLVEQADQAAAQEAVIKARAEGLVLYKVGGGEHWRLASHFY